MLNIAKLIVFACCMLLLSGICNGQGQTSFGATRAQDFSYTAGQLKLGAYAGAADTTIMILLPSGVVKAVAKGTFSGEAYTAGYGIDILGSEISVDTTVIATKSDLDIPSWQQTLAVGDTALQTVTVNVTDSSEQWGINIIKTAINSPTIGATNITASSGIRVASAAAYTNSPTTDHEIVGVGSLAAIGSFNTGNWTNTALVAGGRSIFSVINGASGTAAWINGHHVRVAQGAPLFTATRAVGVKVDFDGSTQPITHAVGYQANLSTATGAINKTYFYADGHNASNAPLGHWGIHIRQDRATTDTMRNYLGLGKTYIGDTSGFGLLNVVGRAQVNRGVYIGTNALDSGRILMIGNVNASAQGIQAGTVSVTAGSPTVTGVGTYFSSTLRKGDIIEISGGSFTVLTVNSNTTVTLTSNVGFSASGTTYALVTQRHRLWQHDVNGNIRYEGNVTGVGQVLVAPQANSTIYNTNANIRGVEVGQGTVSFTAAPYTASYVGFYASPRVAATNTQNWSNTNSLLGGGLVGAVLSPATVSGSTGTMSLQTGLLIDQTANMATTDIRGITILNHAGAGAITNNIGINIAQQTRGTNNTGIAYGTATTGNWFIYNSTSDPNTLTTGNSTSGTFLSSSVGSTTTASYAIGLANTGLYQSAAGRIDMTVSGSNLYRWDNTGAAYILSNNNLAGYYIGTSSDVGVYRGSSGGTLNLYQNSTAAATISSTKMTVSRSLNIGTVSEYADNAAALAAGLVNGDVYRTGDVLKIVHP